MGVLIQLSNFSKHQQELIFDPKNKCRFAAREIRERLCETYPYLSYKDIQFAAWRAWRLDRIAQGMGHMIFIADGSRERYMSVLVAYIESKRPAGFASCSVV